jgi:Xaa-Pro aminopeptidase
MTDDIRPDWAGRLRRLQAQLSSVGCDAVLVSTAHNVTYLCGFKGSAGWLLVGPGGAVLMVDGRYTAAVRRGLADGSIGPVTDMPVAVRYDQTLAEAVQAAGANVVGFEAESATVAAWRAWQKRCPDVTWQATDGLVEQQRVVKDEFEIRVMRRAGRALADVARRLGGLVVVGRTELEVARAIDRSMEQVGFERPAFDTIVASGLNTALPHARPSDRRLAAGDLVLLDFGGVLDGYCVDITRMAAIGRPAAAIGPMFEAVRAAQQAAIDAVQSGVLSSDVDRAAREVLEARGYGAAFCHGTGHGLGRDVHEAPRLTRAESAPPVRLESGMIVTIEPGAYVDDLGGIRLEDDVLVTAGGSEVLTDVPRDLLVV